MKKLIGLAVLMLAAASTYANPSSNPVSVPIAAVESVVHYARHPRAVVIHRHHGRHWVRHPVRVYPRHPVRHPVRVYARPLVRHHVR